MKKKYRKISHKEFLKMVNCLINELDNFLKENNLKVDYVVPNLRSGAVPAVYIANKMNMVKFAPFQVKYSTTGNNDLILQKLFNPFKALEIKKEEPVFLVVEGNHDTGASIKICIDEIKANFPKSKILYVSLVRAYGSETFENDVIFERHAFVRGTTDMSEEECKKLKLDPTWIVFPWESIEGESQHPDDLMENIFF